LVESDTDRLTGDSLFLDVAETLSDCYQEPFVTSPQPRRAAQRNSGLLPLLTAFFMASRVVLTWLDIFGAVVRVIYQGH
jgi:hypothetical protein